MSSREARDSTTASFERKPRLWQGLSMKLLVFTALFVMIGEVFIYVPSIANFRIAWLKNKIALAEVAALAVEAAPDGRLPDTLRSELLRGAGVRIVALNYGSSRQLMLREPGDHMIKARFDLRRLLWVGAIYDAFSALAHGGDRVIGVVDKPPNMSGDLIDLALDEKPLYQAMIDYSFNILKLSVVLSILVAGLVYGALNVLLIWPVRRITSNMLSFAKSPDDARRIISPTARRDEIGIAERQLERMQLQIADMLKQKSRLASLGLAVSKVSHDLRNMLASAQLISDRLGTVDDPTVKKFAPKLISSLDRAIEFCAQTLKFGSAQERPPRREIFPLRQLVEDVVETAVIQASSQIVLYNDVPGDVEMDADRDHVFRILMNLTRNAIQVLESSLGDGLVGHEGKVRIKAWRDGGTTFVEVADNGPGVPDKVRDHLFEAFRSSARAGGTGLGLTISQELAKAHGGEVRLLSDTGQGARFWLVIPDRAVELRPGRRGSREESIGTGIGR